MCWIGKQVSEISLETRGVLISVIFSRTETTQRNWYQKMYTGEEFGSSLHLCSLGSNFLRHACLSKMLSYSDKQYICLILNPLAGIYTSWSNKYHNDGSLPWKQALKVGVDSEESSEVSVRHQKGRNLSLWLLPESRHFTSCPTPSDNYPPPF